MPWWSGSDTFHDDPRWSAMAAGARVTVDQLQAGWARLMSIAARHQSDGWLTADTARSQARPAVLQRLATRVLAEASPMLHTRDDECECWLTWRAGYDYVLHQFLKKNPAKRETERHRGQEQERKDPRIRAQVYGRDGGCCRYCRSGPMKRSGMGRSRDRRRVISYDHVDPDALAGEDLSNLVVSCARCNEYKGARTPDEADMLLLPAPTPQQREQWLAREELRLDPPPPPRQGIDGRQQTDSGSTATATADQTAVPTAVETAVGTADPDAVATGDVCPDPGGEQQRQDPQLWSAGGRSGRVGPAPSVGVPPAPGQPARPADAPDVYHRRSRDPPAGSRQREPPPLEELAEADHGQ